VPPSTPVLLFSDVKRPARNERALPIVRSMYVDRQLDMSNDGVDPSSRTEHTAKYTLDSLDETRVVRPRQNFSMSIALDQLRSDRSAQLVQLLFAHTRQLSADDGSARVRLDEVRWTDRWNERRPDDGTSPTCNCRTRLPRTSLVDSASSLLTTCPARLMIKFTGHFDGAKLSINSSLYETYNVTRSHTNVEHHR
jgi:hypothetical protein